jgi:hypothetical protein
MYHIKPGKPNGYYKDSKRGVRLDPEKGDGLSGNI